jgi:hypothetical protein
MASRAARQLTGAQRNFIEYHCIDGMPIYRAYLKAFRHIIAQRPAGKMVDTSAARAGRIILDSEYGKLYADELKDRVAEKAQQKKFLSLEEKREYLAKLVRSPLIDADEHNNLAEEVTREADGRTKIKMPSRLKALELDARIMGEFRDTVRLDVSEKVLKLAGDLA